MLRGARDDGRQGSGSDTARLGHARDLIKSRLGRDMGVEARGGGRDQIQWNGTTWYENLERLDVGRDAVVQDLRRGAEVGAGRGEAVIAFARRRRARMEIT